jgi:hypothetical protein
MESCIAKSSDKINTRKRVLIGFHRFISATVNPIVKHLKLKTIQINSG